ncbi:MAG: nuclear transport factor 2 family protein [candidate division WOR-3 bacterium]|nr:MAG: nuclear transport factor 2 family protein [candidate division WOR-3 bacterium]
MNEQERAVREFWRIFDEARYDDVRPLLHPACPVYWPNTRELFRGSKKLIDANKYYPGRWFIEVVDVISKDDTVVSVVRVYSKEKKESFYATSFFKFKDGLIAEMTEYWGEITEPPAWRLAEGLSERY